MKRAILGSCLALAVSFAASVAWAQAQPPQDEPNKTALELWIAGEDQSDSRKDAEENTIPLPPSGPATPIPYCGPSDPICP